MGRILHRSLQQLIADVWWTALRGTFRPLVTLLNLIPSPLHDVEWLRSVLPASSLRRPPPAPTLMPPNSLPKHRVGSRAPLGAPFPDSRRPLPAVLGLSRTISSAAAGRTIHRMSRKKVPPRTIAPPMKAGILWSGTSLVAPPRGGMTF